VEALNWRVTVAGPRPSLVLRPAGAGGGEARDAVKAHRRAYFAEAAGFVETPVYDRYALAPGTAFRGPAIVEERESTAVLGPGADIRVDPDLALVVEMPR
jgi:N-methylhydantoinase A/oxoprolinase/acetone carboxylase beta subunit